jgi:hypothetical protein
VLAYYTPLRGTQERALFDLLRHAKDDPFRSWWDGAPFATAPHVPIQLVLSSEGGRLINDVIKQAIETAGIGMTFHTSSLG